MQLKTFEDLHRENHNIKIHDFPLKIPHGQGKQGKQLQVLVSRRLAHLCDYSLSNDHRAVCSPAVAATAAAAATSTRKPDHPNSWDQCRP